MAKTEYEVTVKAAVMAALLAGQSISSVAQEYQIPRGTVCKWSASMRRTQADGITKKPEIGDLLTRYLEANLQALAKQMEVFSDVDWLKKQPASELAVLHGVMADKSIRLLEAHAAATAVSEAEEA